MLVPREWSDNHEVFEAVAVALEEAGLDVIARDEEGPYRERGYIVVELDGKKYRLELREEV